MTPQVVRRGGVAEPLAGRGGLEQQLTALSNLWKGTQPKGRAYDEASGGGSAPKVQAGAPQEDSLASGPRRSGLLSAPYPVRGPPVPAVDVTGAIEAGLLGFCLSRSTSRGLRCGPVERSAAAADIEGEDTEALGVGPAPRSAAASDASRIPRDFPARTVVDEAARTSVLLGPRQGRRCPTNPRRSR